MPRELKISVGQHSDKGRKETNQDFHGVLIPDEPLLSLKGIAIVLADGITSSNVSRVAAESAVKGFLTDYYCTSESWSVRTSAQRVLEATNSWLHSQTRRSQYSYDKDRGYVCTLSAMVIKSTTGAHLSCRRQPDLSPLRQLARTADQRPPRRHFLGAELSRPRARREFAGRNRLSDVQDRAGRHLRAGRPTASTSMSATASLQGRSRTARRISTWPRRTIVEHGVRSRQQGQSHRPDRPRR